MSQGDMNSVNNCEKPKDLTNDSNLNGENSVIISTENENSQYSDKKVFDQDLNTPAISNEPDGKRSSLSETEKDEHNVNSGNNEPWFENTSNVSSEAFDREDQQNNKEDENDTVLNSEQINENAEDEVKEAATQETINDRDTARKEIDAVYEDTDLKVENKAGFNVSESVIDKTEIVQEHQEKGPNILGSDTDNQNDEKKEDEGYKDDFEEGNEENLTEEKSPVLNGDLTENETVITQNEPNKIETIDENKQTDLLNGETPKESAETDSNDKENSRDSTNNVNSIVEKDDEVLKDDGDEIPKVILTTSGDPPDSDSEQTGEINKLISEDSQQINDSKDFGDKLKENNASNSNEDSGLVGNSNNSESNETLEQKEEQNKTDDDNDAFWDIGETDRENLKESQNSVTENREESKEETNIAVVNNSSLNPNSQTEDKEDLNEVKTPRVNVKKEEIDKRMQSVQGEKLTTKEVVGNMDAINATKSNVDNSGLANRQHEEEKELEEPPQHEPVQQPEPESMKQESLLDQLLKRNVEIDGSVDSISDLENNVITLLQSMKTVVKHYSEQLNLQSLRDFSTDMGKFRGDFKSINEAYQRCGQLATTMSNHLKELRHCTEDVKTTIYRKFQNEDLGTWIDIQPEKEAEKQRLQEHVIAAEKSAMAKAAEARAAMATAAVGVTEANQFVAETETQAAEAEAVAKKASVHAQQALLAAEEARLAAEEKRRAEEAAKQRAEEKARKKEEEEKRRQAEEEMKIYQDAAKKGTSVEDERKLLQQERERKEAERKDPKNWPRLTYAVERGDFDPRVGCIIRAIDGTMLRDDVQCRRIGQESGILQLSNNEELISNIIEITPTDQERKFHFDEPMSIALPVCIKRTPFAREAVMKIQQASGRWSELQTADVVFEDNREQRFVETRIRKFGTFVVVLRYKKDTLMLLKKGVKVTSAVDSRVSFTCKPGTFNVDTTFSLEVHPVDQTNVTNLRARVPQDCEELYTCSPFIKLNLPTRKTLAKPLTVTIPLPPHHSRLKRPQTAVAKEQSRDSDARPATARPTSTQERKDESTEEVHFVYFDDKNGWTNNGNTVITQITNKDMVSFDITEPYQRFIVLRTKIGLKSFMVEKMATLLNRSLTQRDVKAFLRQRNQDLYDVVISCDTSEKTDRTLKYLADEGFTEGAPPSKDLILKEGQSLYIRFRGNVKCINENPRLRLIFNTHIKCRTDLKVTELDTFAQKGLPCYRGFAQVFTRALVPKPVQEGTKKPNEPPEMIEAEILLTELLIEIPKPEAEPPKPLNIAPVKLVDGPLNDSVFQHIAKELGKEWKEVAAHLNLKPMRIQAILRQNVNKDTPKTRYDMLLSWAKRIPKSVDKVNILVQALQASGRPDLAEEIRYRGDEFRQQRIMSARVSHLRQAFVKVAKVNTIFKHWKDFAKGLGVPDQEIQKIEEKGGSGQEKCYTSLEAWKEISGEDATIPALASHLKGAKQERLSRDVEALVAS